MAIRRALCLLPLCAALGACDTTAPVVRDAVPFEIRGALRLHLADERPPSAVLRDEVEEARYLEAYPRQLYRVNGDEYVEPFPAVDYDTEVAFVVSLPHMPGNISVRIDSVVAEGREATVYTTQIVPCVTTRDVVNEVVIAVVEDSGRRLAFAPRATERLPCLL